MTVYARTYNPIKTYYTECSFIKVTNEKILLTFKLEEETFINDYFHVVNKNFPKETNGVLGRDFLQNYSATMKTFI